MGGREVTLAQQYAAIAVGSIPLFVIAGAGEWNLSYINPITIRRKLNIKLLLAFWLMPTCLISGTAVFWVIGASFFVIAIHASFYNFDALDLPLDDTQKLTGQIFEEV